ncbi:MAG: hypothetical protein ABEI27_03450 [Halobellus sp.]|uniref:hypothetical protein n=1 Tax=Halobellus sp. TaxID=1979212 RepID=UPI0035D436EB
MNHIPDSALNAIDDFGESLLFGAPPTVQETLRGDLRIEITRVDSDASITYIDCGTDSDTEPVAPTAHLSTGAVARCRYESTHTQAPPTLRALGSFVITIVDGIDQRLRSWGIEPPAAYIYTETVEGTHRYEGLLALP